MESPRGKAKPESIESADVFDLLPSEIGAIEQLEVPLGKILEDMRPGVEEHVYGVIIADDASGRIPALVLGYVLKELYEKTGHPAPLLRPIAGSRGVSDAERKMKMIYDYLLTVRSTMKQSGRGERALVVTDHIETGKGLDPLIDALKELKWPVEVASVTIGFDDLAKRLTEKWNVPVHFGHHSDYAGLIYTNPISGVEKSPGELFAKRNDAPDEKVQSARQIARDSAKELVKRFENHTLVQHQQNNAIGRR